MKVAAAKITLELGEEEMSVFYQTFWSNMDFSNHW